MSSATDTPAGTLPPLPGPGPETWAELRLGISTCLMGEEVRWDGGHKRDGFLMGTVGEHVRWVPVCPEVDIGLGTPREPIRLVRDGETLRLVGTKSGDDHTEAMVTYSAEKVAQLADWGLSGYILKKDSPTCGMERVKVYDHNGIPARDGRGLYAAELMARYPLLPVEEEGRLHDPRLRENFFERVFAYQRLSLFFSRPWSIGDLVAFHSREKYLLLAHHQENYRKLGRLVARAKEHDPATLAVDYGELFMTALGKLAGPGRHRNVLQHMMGYFSERLSPAERQELVELTEDYAQQLVPLVVPLTLVRHYVRIHEVDYLAGQTYLEPHPKELMLRNHV